MSETKKVLSRKRKDNMMKKLKSEGFDSFLYSKMDFRSDKDFVIEVLNKYRGFLIKDRDDYFMKYEKHRPILKCLSKNLRSDRDILLTVVGIDGSNLYDADKKFWKDREVVKKAASSYGYVLGFVVKKFLLDREVVLSAVKNENSMGAIIEINEEFKNDREIAFEAVKNDGHCLEYINERFRSDREIVLKAVSSSGVTLEYACDEFKNDKEIVFLAIKENGLSICHASDSFKDDYDLAYEAVKQNGFAYKCISNRLQKDTKFIDLALSYKCNKYLESELKDMVSWATKAIN